VVERGGQRAARAAVERGGRRAATIAADGTTRTQAPARAGRAGEAGAAAVRRRDAGRRHEGAADHRDCECGERHELFYGERWTCPVCGRAYDSNQIPADEYAQIRRLELRYRAVPIALGVTVAALAILFTLTGNILGVFFIMPVALITWFVFIRPTRRRRYRAAIADLPRWDLRAD
jgi:Flp pilus assembly protein TadB